MSAPSLELLQITLIVEDLAGAEREFREGLGLEVAFRDPGVAQWGLENIVLPMGETFIEILSPERPDTPGGRHLARQGGDGGYMVILKTPSLSEWRKRIAEVGVRIAFEADLPPTPEGPGWAGLHLHPGDTGGMMISLDRPDPFDSWAGAGPDWRPHVRQDVVDGLTSISLRTPNPAALAARWAEVLDRPVIETADGPRIDLDAGALRFVPAAPGESEGLAAIALRATDRKRVGSRMALGGVAFDFV